MSRELYDEAFLLIERAQQLLLEARAKHEAALPPCDCLPGMCKVGKPRTVFCKHAKDMVNTLTV